MSKQKVKKKIIFEFNGDTVEFPIDVPLPKVPPKAISKAVPKRKKYGWLTLLPKNLIDLMPVPNLIIDEMLTQKQVDIQAMIDASQKGEDEWSEFSGKFRSSANEFIKQRKFSAEEWQIIGDEFTKKCAKAVPIHIAETISKMMKMPPYTVPENFSHQLYLMLFSILRPIYPPYNEPEHQKMLGLPDGVRDQLKDLYEKTFNKAIIAPVYR